MSGRDRIASGTGTVHGQVLGQQPEQQPQQQSQQQSGTDLLRPLMAAASTNPHAAQLPGAVVIGELIGIGDGGRTPLVLFPGQHGSAALAARTVIDLHGAHIGCNVVLMFEAADPGRPIVMGVLREGGGWPLDDAPGQVEVDVDGERLIVSAKEQLVLRCGEASITLTKAGKVLICGSYVLSRSSGVNRVKGGSVQLN
jgi:hypothetical protein